MVSTIRQFVERAGTETDALTWTAFLVDNLAPVTLGDVIGGGLLVAAVHGLVYLRPRRQFLV